MITIWVEIPALNLERAKTFHAAVFQYPPTEICRPTITPTHT